MAFEKIDRPALRPLPERRYEYAEWKRTTLGPDYHVEVDGHYYSVPCRLIRKKVDLRLTQKVVECFHKGVRVASHLRSEAIGELTTIKEHMPPSHQHYLEQTPENLIASAERIGPDVSIFIKAILDSRKQHLGNPVLSRGFAPCKGIWTGEALRSLPESTCPSGIFLQKR